VGCDTADRGWIAVKLKVAQARAKVVEKSAFGGMFK